jgi:hypothetical protein
VILSLSGPSRFNRPRIAGGSTLIERSEPWRSDRGSPLVRERTATGPGHEPEYPSQWAAIRSIAGSVGCSPAALRNWVRQAKREEGRRLDQTTYEATAGEGLEGMNCNSSGLKHFEPG